MKTRSASGGGIKLYQIIAFGYALTLYKNSSWSNGDVHSWRIRIDKFQ